MERNDGWQVGVWRTSIHLTTYYHFYFPEAGADDRAVLRVIVNDLVLARLDVFSWGGIPEVGDQGKGLEFVACLMLC